MLSIESWGCFFSLDKIQKNWCLFICNFSFHCLKFGLLCMNGLTSIMLYACAKCRSSWPNWWLHLTYFTMYTSKIYSELKVTKGIKMKKIGHCFMADNFHYNYLFLDRHCYSKSTRKQCSPGMHYSNHTSHHARSLCNVLDLANFNVYFL